MTAKYFRSFCEI